MTQPYISFAFPHIRYECRHPVVGSTDETVAACYGVGFATPAESLVSPPQRLGTITDGPECVILGEVAFADVDGVVQDCHRVSLPEAGKCFPMPLQGQSVASRRVLILSQGAYPRCLVGGPGEPVHGCFQASSGLDEQASSHPDASAK